MKIKIAFTAVIATLALAAGGLALNYGTAAAHAGYGDGSGWGPGMMGGHGWGMWFLGPLTMVILLGVLIAGVVLLVRSLSGGAGGGKREDDAEVILRRRFASGDLTKEEYSERLKVLKG